MHSKLGQLLSSLIFSLVIYFGHIGEVYARDWWKNPEVETWHAQTSGTLKQENAPSIEELLYEDVATTTTGIEPQKVSGTLPQLELPSGVRIADASPTNSLSDVRERLGKKEGRELASLKSEKPTKRIVSVSKKIKKLQRIKKKLEEKFFTEDRAAVKAKIRYQHDRVTRHLSMLQNQRP